MIVTVIIIVMSYNWVRVFKNESTVPFLNPMTPIVMLCAVWYHSYSLKNMKNTNGGVLLLVKLQAEVCNFA